MSENNQNPRVYSKSINLCMPDDAPKYTIRDDYDPDDEMPTDTDPLEAYQTYVDDRDAGHGDMGFTLEDFERYIAEMRQRRKRRLPSSGAILGRTTTGSTTYGSKGVAVEFQAGVSGLYRGTEAGCPISSDCART